MGIIEEIFKPLWSRIVRWLELGPNWLVLIPWFVVLLLSYYYLSVLLARLEFVQDLLLDWRTPVIVGVLCSVAALIYGFICRKKMHLLLGTCPPLIIGGVFVLVGVAEKPPLLPEGKIVIAVAEFKPETTAEAQVAKRLKGRHVRKLQDMEKKGQPIQVKSSDVEIKGSSDQECRAFAIKAFRNRAHIVVWAEIWNGTDGPRGKPMVEVATQPRTTQLEREKLQEFPGSLELKGDQFGERFAEKLVNFSVFVCGLALYELKKWDEAIQKFENVTSPEGHLYRGLCLYERGKVSQNPGPLHQQAIKAYEKLKLPDGSEDPDAVQTPKWKALLSTGVAYTELGTMSRTGEWRCHLEKAISMFRAAKKLRPRNRQDKKYDKEWALAQHYLGIALFNLGIRVKGEEGQQYLREADAAYREALGIHTEDALPEEWAKTLNNRANVLQSLALEVKDKEGEQYLHQAVAAYSEVGRKVFTHRAKPHEWGAIQNNLGDALARLGKRVADEEGKRYLRDAVAAFRKALEVFAPESSPRNWATTWNNLGLALKELGSKVKGEESKRYLQDAVAAYRESLKIRTQETFPQEWARTNKDLGIALIQLGIRVGGEEFRHNLDEAISCFTCALTGFDERDSEHAETRANR
ncbi:MAG: tetratricopeptide repeat protein, partial [Deltaproteobacteria bacterium]|nr:tetratricopeptide repeat protein [Deltaproteobacteria bacterium]